MSESSLMGQVNELLPFVHYAEGHWLATTLSVVLWLSLLYAIYSFSRRLARR